MVNLLNHNLFLNDINGNDVTGDGSRAKPWRTIYQATKNLQQGGEGYRIFLKEGQDHVLTEDKNLTIVNLVGLVSFSPYGDKLDELAPIWFSGHSGARTMEPLEASEEYEAYLPRIIFETTNVKVPNHKTNRYNQVFYLTNLSFY